MHFEIQDSRLQNRTPNESRNRVYLVRDNWDDYGYKTQFFLNYIDKKGQTYSIGAVKIGQFDMSRPVIKYKSMTGVTIDLPDSFEYLDKTFFSLGQNVDYYANLKLLEDDIRKQILSRLNDVSYKEELFEKAESEHVMQTSLLRYISPISVKGQYRRLAHGGANLIDYDFKYTAPIDSGAFGTPLELNFEIKAGSNPPTNIHAIIGRNGVGKTYLLNNIVNCWNTFGGQHGSLTATSRSERGSWTDFHNLILISFSAFEQPNICQKSEYFSYVGLQKQASLKIENEDKTVVEKSPTNEEEFYQKLKSLKEMGQEKQWANAINLLKEDWILSKEDVTKLIFLDEKNIKEKFNQFNSTHKAVLLTTAKLVEKFENESVTKSPTVLSEEFYQSLNFIKGSRQDEKWVETIKILASDPIFKDSNIVAWLNMNEKEVKKKFNQLSSGHKIILLTVTQLAEKVQEQTLVILDEPEGHLHPPLLSAFIRALSDLLISRNGAAIIATHSPVVLQDVPKKCVYILDRRGHVIEAYRPEMETFGENLGVLNREIFGFEIAQSGFHTLLKHEVEEETDFESILKKFNSELGMEARAILRILLMNKLRKEEQSCVENRKTDF